MKRRLADGSLEAGKDPREQALYTPADAACYLGIHPQTLSNWLWGRRYKTKAAEKFFAPLIKVADPRHQLLSFFNLAELHVLAATRYQHKVTFQAVRTAVETLQQRYPSPHPLISRDFKTNGKDLFLLTMDVTENLSAPDQLNLKSIMDTFLAHVVEDEHSLVKKIFPLIAGQQDDRIISITYGISSSQPVIDGFGVPVWLVHNRYKSGEELDSIADDFGVPVDQISRAVTYFEQRPS